MAAMGYDAPKANTVDFEHPVLGHDLKGFIAFTTTINVMQPFPS
jgi:hypothetical protein